MAPSTLLDGADLVSVMTANNEVGTVQPIPALVALVHETAPDAVVHSDAVAAAPWLDLAQSTQGADLVTICGHKLGGPVGVGALCVRREVALAPLIVGGGQERGRRAGTPDVAAAVGLATALRLACEERAATCALDRDASRPAREAAHERTRWRHAHGLGCRGAPGHLPRPGRRRWRARSWSTSATRRGCACRRRRAARAARRRASHVLAAMGVDDEAASGSLRLTIGAETTDDDVDRAAAIVVCAVRRLRSSSS